MSQAAFMLDDSVLFYAPTMIYSWLCFVDVAAVVHARSIDFLPRVFMCCALYSDPSSSSTMNYESGIQRLWAFPRNNNSISMQRRFLITFLTIIIFSAARHMPQCTLHMFIECKWTGGRSTIEKWNSPQLLCVIASLYMCHGWSILRRGSVLRYCAPCRTMDTFDLAATTKDNFPCRLLVNTFKELLRGPSDDKERVQISFFELRLHCLCKL